MSDASPAFAALADPTRRHIFECLGRGEHSVRELTELVPVSQPAVSQHLKVLEGAGLVSARPDGRRRLYRIELAGLTPIRAWVDSFWDDVLLAFTEHANPKEP